MSKDQKVQRSAQQLQNALDHIQSMQMRIDSMVSDIKTSQEFKKPLTNVHIQCIHDELLIINQTLLKIVPVLTGHELPKRG